MSVTTGSGYIFANYLRDAVSYVLQYDYDGKLISQIELPGVGTVSGFSGKKEDKTLYYSFTNYITPGSIYSYIPGRQTSDLYRRPKIEFNSDDYITKQVFYNSKDGTRVPMIITYKKD